MADSAITVENDGSVTDFLAQVENPVRRRDAETLRELMERVTGKPARMWGSAIVGFGSYHYVYDSGREGDMPVVGFSPRKAATTVYLVDGFDTYSELLGALGPHSLGKSCLYIKDLGKVDLRVLEDLVRSSYETVEGWPQRG